MQNVSPPVGVPAKKSMSPEVRSRLVLVALPLIVLILVGGGLYGLQAASSRGLELGYPAPVVNIVSSVSGTVALNQSVTFTAEASGRGDLTYTWNFGDQNTATGATVTHAYQQVSNTNDYTYTVTVTATDVLGRTASSSLAVKVLPAAPIANFRYSEETDYYGNYNQTIDFDASSSTLDTQDASYSYYWNFGDGATDSSSSTTDSHYYSTTGSYTVTLTITDNFNQSNSVSITITVS